MTYAEQFNAPSWLEGPAQWLWWAMQSRINGNLEDARYNLGEFWKSLEGMKRVANEATWPEILALDSQSHIQAANITSGIINAMQQDLNTATAWMGIFGWQGLDSKDAIRKMQDQRSQELATAEGLANQARNATAQRVEALAAGRLSQDEAERAQENKDIENIIRNNSTLDFAGIPWWAWLLGCVGVAGIVWGRR